MNSHTARTEQGHTVDLSQVSASGRFDYDISVVRFFHASIAVFTPCEDGQGSYCYHAVCTHNHPDTDEGSRALHQCADRLSLIINTGKRLPKWAVLHVG